MIVKEYLSTTVLPKTTNLLAKEESKLIMDYILIMHSNINPYEFPQIVFSDRNEGTTELFIMYIETSQEILNKIFKKLTIEQLFKELDEYLINKCQDTDKTILNKNKFSIFENKIINDKRILLFIDTYKMRQKNNNIIVLMPFNDNFHISEVNKQFFKWIHFLTQNQIYVIKDTNG